MQRPDTTSGPINPAGADDALLIDVVAAVLVRGGGQRWALTPTQAWCSVRPPTGLSPKHGWKLHVSATALSAPLVLARAAEVLVRHHCPFKFGTDLRRVAELTGMWYPRGSAGKFITAYPRDLEQFRLLAGELHRVTVGLAGPRILSDQQLSDDSLVHYRYGAFTEESVFTDDGMFESRLTGPDGSMVPDQRRAWFCPPPWAPAPFPQAPAGAAVAPQSPVLGGRFRVDGVIRHANRGGIYRASDTRSESAVLIKQARPHVGALLDGTDVRDRLRGEARMLDVLAPLALYPAKLGLFEEQDHLFLVEEFIPGTTLDGWSASRVRTPPDLLTLAGRLVAAVHRVHEANLVIRDLKPANVMVTPTGQIRMIDAEFVVELGRSVYPAFTRAFAAPELTQAGPAAPVTTSARAADCFSLGVTLFCALTGMTDVEWVFGSVSAPRTDCERESLIPLVLADHHVPAVLGELITGLTLARPQARWSLQRAGEFLAPSPDVPATSVPGRRAVPVPQYRLHRLLADGITRLQRTMTPDQAQLWADPRKVPTDPCNLWLGAAGGLSTLARACVSLEDRSVHESLTVAASWVDERRLTVPRLLPGLGFGRAGSAWALYDAATVLGDDALAGRAVDLARRLPTEGPIVDLTHGLSGAGLAYLHLWLNTGDVSLLERATITAEAVLRAAHRDGEDWAWPTPGTVDSGMAGNTTYGFAHGIAGVGTFLLAAAESLAGAAAEAGRSSVVAAHCRQAALGAGDTLVRAVRIVDGAPTWPSEVGGGDLVTPSGHWCNGAAGIGMFLIRLWAASGDQRFADLAQQCVPGPRSLWHSGIGACCGLAGVGHALLDLAEIGGEERFRAGAGQIADLLHTRRHRVGGLLTTGPAEAGAAYKDGSTGVLTFLLRQQHGGPAPWLPHRHAEAVRSAPAGESSPAQNGVRDARHRGVADASG